MVNNTSAIQFSVIGKIGLHFFSFLYSHFTQTFIFDASRLSHA